MLVPTQAANRDGEEFANPNELDYARSPNRHLGFGLGPHRCLGIHLARPRAAHRAPGASTAGCPTTASTRRAARSAFGGMKGLASLPLLRE